MSTTGLPVATESDWRKPFFWILLTPTVTAPLSVLLFVLLVGTHDGSQARLPSTSPLPVPLEALQGCIIDCPSYTAYDYSDATSTIVVFTVPGILNLAPFGWALSKKPKVRIAGIVGGLLGLLRLAVPPTVLITFFTRLTGTDGTSYFQYSLEVSSYSFFSDPIMGAEPSFLLELLLAVWGIGFLVWLASISVFVAMASLMKEGRDAC